MAHFVTDTNSIIRYFHHVFGVSEKLSPMTISIFERALDKTQDSVKLSIPSVVFVEIYIKWFTTDEFVRKFFYEVYIPLTESPNIEIKSIDTEVLENFLSISGIMKDHDLHDKIILASAMMLECALITTDQVIIKYVSESKVIPRTLN